MWSDYVCPWAYLGRDRTALLRDLGLEVTQFPYELHPEIPRGGVAVRPGSRLAQVFARIGTECDECGIPFNAPTRSPNTRFVLEASEIVRLHHPDAFSSFDEALATAHWVDDLDLEDRDLVYELAERSGAPAADLADGVADGVGTAAVEAAMLVAREHGVTATPAWWVNDALLIPGAQPRDTMTRWVTKLLVRAQTDAAD